jgi:hypothetical protein
VSDKAVLGSELEGIVYNAVHNNYGIYTEPSIELHLFNITSTHTHSSLHKFFMSSLTTNFLPSVHVIFQSIITNWTLSTKNSNPSEYMQHVDYLTNEAAFSNLFLKHLERVTTVRTNAGQDIGQLSNLNIKMKDQVSIFTS